MSASLAGPDRGASDPEALVALGFLLLVLLALCGAYVVGQSAQAQRCERGGCEPVAAGRSWT